MSDLPPEMEKEGWLAYEQARAFESLRRRRLPWIYAGFTTLVAAMGLIAAESRRPFVAAALFAVAVFFPLFTWMKWRFFRFRHGENLARLAELKAAYGESLPWLEVERHLAELEKLRGELAAGRAGSGMDRT